MILITIRPGLVLAPEELPEHVADPAVRAILETGWPPLFDSDGDVYLDGYDEPYIEHGE